MLGEDRFVVSDYSKQKGIIVQIRPISEIKETEGMCDFTFLVSKNDNGFVVEKAFEFGQEFEIENYQYFGRQSFNKTISSETNWSDYKMVKNFIDTLPHKVITKQSHKKENLN